MAMVKRVDLINNVCRRMSCKRRDLKKGHFDKRELRYLDSFMSVVEIRSESTDAHRTEKKTA